MPYISSGTSTNLIVSSGQTWNVCSQGLVSKTTVYSSGTLNVYSSGRASNTYVNPGGVYNVYNYGSAYNDKVGNSGTLNIYNYGYAYMPTVASDGKIYIYSNGVANNVTVSSGGNLYLSSGGTASSVTILASGGVYGVVTVSAGGVLNIANTSGGKIYVYGGTAISAAVGADAFIHIARGEVTRASVGSGGTMTNYGVANSTLVSSGGSVRVHSGGVMNSTTVRGIMHVSSSGMANTTWMYSGGVMHVSYGGVASGTTVFSGGLAQFSSGASADDVYIYQGSAYASGATVTNLRLNSGYFHAYGGGTNGTGAYTTISSAQVNAGTINLFVGSMTNVTIGAAGSVSVLGANILSFPASGYLSSARVYGWLDVGHRAYDTTVLSGGTMFVDSTGAAIRATVSSGGKARVYGSATTVAISAGGSMDVSSGGIASGVAVYSSGCLWVYGGSATNVNVYNGGMIKVFNNPSYGVGRATSVTINNGALGYVYGSATSVTISSGGTFFACSSSPSIGFSRGGYVESAFVYGLFSVENSAYYTRVYSGGSVRVLNSASVSQTHLSGGRMDLFSGAYAYGVWGSGGVVNVMSGATLSSATVHNHGRIIISSGATGINIRENGGYVRADGNVTFIENTFSSSITDEATAHSGTTLYSGAVYSGGTLHLLSGGRAIDAFANAGGEMWVSSGGDVYSTTINNSGRINVYSSGWIGDCTLNAGGALYVYGGVASNTTMYGGEIRVEDGGNLWYTTIKSGLVTVSSGGTAAKVTLSGGTLGLSGGSAYDVTVSSGAQLIVLAGETGSRTTISSGGLMLVNGGAYASNGSVEESGSAYIYSNGNVSNFAVIGSMDLLGRASAIWVANGGVMNVYSGGTAGKDFTIGHNGTVNVSKGGYVSETTVSASGVLNVYSGGVAANSVTVNARGIINVYSGGSVTGIEVNVNSGGSVTVYNGGSAVSAFVNSGGLMDVSNGGFANSTTLNAGGHLYVYTGGSASNTTVNSDAVLLLSGGKTSDTSVEGGLVYMYDGTASHTVVSGVGGGIVVFDGALADFTIVSSGAEMFVNFGGSAYDVNLRDGTLKIDSCGYGSGVYVSSGGFATVCKDAILDTAAVYDDGTLKFLDGAYGTGVVGRGGEVIVSGAVVNTLTMLDGTAAVFDGGVMNGVLVGSDGILYAYTGTKVTGYLFIDGGSVTMAVDSVLDFNLEMCVSMNSGALVETEIPLVNDLSLVAGMPNYTMTVFSDGIIRDETYLLAQGASGFNSSISVMDAGGTTYGSFGLGETIEVGGQYYTLNLNGDDLSVTLSSYSPGPGPGPEPTPTPDRVFFAGDFNGDGSDTLAVETYDASGTTLTAAVTIYQNGEPWGLGVSMEPGWEVVGVGDFSGDGLDDFLRVNDEGYVVGEMSNGNGTFSPQVLNLKNAGWDILGVGDFNGNGTDDVLIANPTGASEVVGLLGYWESGVTWTLINGYSAEWDMVATGDFNADGKCDMLWRNTFTGDDGGIYNAYCTWIVDPPPVAFESDWRIVSVANPREWNFLCSGDFNGDNMNDIAMINNDGVVGIWGVENGYLSSWSILSAVTQEWTLAGVADFNGDGTDDIAWCNSTTGLTGYWQINDKELTAWANICTVG